jgi:hypothetical protein
MSLEDSPWRELLLRLYVSLLIGRDKGLGSENGVSECARGNEYRLPAERRKAEFDSF